MKEEEKKLTKANYYKWWKEWANKPENKYRAFMVARSVTNRVLSANKHLRNIKEDILSVAYIGVVKAAQSYDPEDKRGASLNTYTYWKVRTEIYNFLKKHKRHKFIPLTESGLLFKDCTPDKDNVILEKNNNSVIPENFGSSLVDAKLPDDLDRYEKLVVKWSALDGMRVQSIKVRLKNLKSRRSYKEIVKSIISKIHEANKVNETTLF